MNFHVKLGAMSVSIYGSSLNVSMSRNKKFFEQRFMSSTAIDKTWIPADFYFIFF